MILTIINILFNIVLLNGLNEQDMKNYLDKNLSDYHSYEYTYLSKKEFAAEEVEIDFSRNFELKGNYGYVPILLKNNKIATKSTITLKLKLYDEVLVANRKIKKGEILRNSDFTIQIEEVTSKKGKLCGIQMNLSNFYSSMNILKGSILLEEMIKEKEDIFIGKKVDAIFNKNSFLITFPVTARNNANIGETIRVKRNDGIVFKAKVISKNEVEIVE